MSKTAQYGRSQLFSLLVFFFLAIDLCLAAPQPSQSVRSARPTKTESSRSSITTKPTKTTKSITTKSSTTKEKTYTWKGVSSRPNCPAYGPTSSLASATYSSDKAQVTAFFNPYGGAVPPQFAVNNVTGNGETYIFRALNNSQILAFRPGIGFILLDNNGMTAYDEKCELGARLYVPNFLNYTVESNPATSAISSSSSLASKRPELSSRTAAGSSKSTKPFGVMFQLYDGCGRKSRETLIGGEEEFECYGLDGVIPGPKSYLERLGTGLYDTKVVAPTINTETCEKDMDSVIKWAEGGLIGQIAEGVGFSAAIGKLKTAAAPEVAETLTSMGLGEAVLVAALTYAATQGAAYVLQHQGASALKKLMCGHENFHYRLTVNTENYGTLLVDEQQSPFHDAYEKVIYLPPNPKTDCNCVDYDSDVKNCGSCGNACGSSQSCFRGSCTNATLCSPPSRCGSGAYCGPQSACFDIQGSSTEGVCSVNTFCDEYTPCPGTTNQECPQDQYCSLLSCCGYAICVGRGVNATATSSRKLSKGNSRALDYLSAA